GRIYWEEKAIEPAIRHTKLGLSMAVALGLKEQVRDASLLLSELYENEKKYQKALTYKNQYIAYKDSLENTETTKKMADLRTEFEVSLKEKEIDLLENHQSLQRTYIIIAVILLLLSIVVLLYFRQRFYAAKLLAAGEKRNHDEKIKHLLNAQETKTLQAMVAGRDQERKHLAQELHNHFGSLLAAIKVNVNSIDQEAITNHSTLITLIDQACADVRNMSHALNMGISEDFGLVPALKELTTFLNESEELDVTFSATLCQRQMDSDCEILIYRIVQELLSNALKHAEATKLAVSMTCFDEENMINVMVEDNGKGFDPESTPNGEGMGINSLTKIVTGRNGEIRFDSRPDSGTTVTIDLPITTRLDLI
ncbi:MAG: ATP-binding protein, partial [Bacteroidota bacterium]